MAAGQVNRIVHHLRWIAHGCEDRAHTDGQLLECFVSRHDESAFEELVRRHGPMVLGVCRRLLSADDADDAFQATFMVLVRKARAVVPRDLVGNWLYGVACRVALHAQVQASRRRAREKQVVDMPHPTAPLVDPANDLRPVLDLELSRLPEKYRVPIVLCDLEGRTRKDVARQIGVPEGTLSSRLATGRKMLADRLTRRGLAVGAAAAATALLGETAQAVVPGTLAVSTIKAAAAGAAGHAVALGLLSAHAATLTEGVMKAMLISKLKAMVAVLLTLGMLTTGAGVVKLTADEPRPGQEVAQAKKIIVVETGDKPKTDAVKPLNIVIDYDGDDLNEAFGQKKATKPPRRDLHDLNNLIDSVIEQPFDRLEMIHSKALRDVVNCKACHNVQSRPPDVVLQDKWFAFGQPQDKKAAADARYLFELGVLPASQVPGRDTKNAGADFLIIRIPKKGGPTADAEFLRRVLLDVAGRPPTTLEMHYFLKDTDGDKHRKVIEKLVEQQDPHRIRVKVAVKVPDRAARAEEYIKEKLGKKQLSTEERQLLLKALEFAEKDRPQATPPPSDNLHHWLEAAPKALQPPQKQPK